MNDRNLALKISKHPLIELLKKDKTISKSVIARLIVEELMEAKPNQKDLEDAGQMSFPFNDEAPDTDNPKTDSDNSEKPEQESDVLEDLAFYMGLAAAPISFVPGVGQAAGTALSIGSDLLEGAGIVRDISEGRTGEATTKLMSIIGANIAAGLIPGGIAAKEGGKAAAKSTAKTAGQTAFAKTAGFLSKKLGKEISEEAVKAAVQKAAKAGAKLAGGKIGEVVSKKAQEHAAKINNDEGLKKSILDQGKDILGDAWKGLKNMVGLGSDSEETSPGLNKLSIPELPAKLKEIKKEYEPKLAFIEEDRQKESIYRLILALKNESLIKESTFEDITTILANLVSEQETFVLKKAIGSLKLVYQRPLLVVLQDSEKREPLLKILEPLMKGIKIKGQTREPAEEPSEKSTETPTSEETVQTSEDPKDYQPFVKASNNLINDFYRQKYKIQQARIVDAVIQSMKEFVDDEDKERAFQRTPDTTEKVEALKEQEEKVEATEDQMRNIRIDIKSFLSRVNKTKEFLTAFEKVAKRGSVLGDAYKKRFIDNLKEIQLAVYRIALILNKILGPKQELDEAKESETLKKWKEVQGKYDQAARAVNSLKELVATETPPTEIDEDLIKDAYDSLVDLSQHFPSVSPFGKPQKGVEMDKVFEKYQLEFGAAIQAVKNSLQTSLNVMKLGEAGRESLQNARDGLRNFADEINTIFGVSSRFADAKVKPEDAKGEAVKGEAGVKEPEQKIQSIDPWAGSLNPPELPAEINLEQNDREELISRVKEALKSSEDSGKVDDIIIDFKKDLELDQKQDKELIKWANKIKVQKETEKIAEEEINKIQSYLEMDETEIMQKVMEKAVEELEKTEISLKDPKQAAELVYQEILDGDDFETFVSKIPQESQKNPKTIIEKEEQELKPLFSGEELKYAEEYAQAVYEYLKENDRLGTWQEPKYKSDILSRMASKNQLLETEGDVTNQLGLKPKEIQAIYNKLSDEAKDWKNKNIIKVEGEKKFGKLVLVLIDKKIIEKFQGENEPPTQILSRFGFDNEEFEIIRRLKKFLDTAAKEALKENKLEIPAQTSKKIAIFLERLEDSEKAILKRALEKAANLDNENKNKFYQFLGIPPKEKEETENTGLTPEEDKVIKDASEEAVEKELEKNSDASNEEIVDAATENTISSPEVKKITADFTDEEKDDVKAVAKNATETALEGPKEKEKTDNSKGVEILRQFFQYVGEQISNKEEQLKESYMALVRAFTDDRRDTGTWEGGTTLFNSIGKYIEENYKEDLIQEIIKKQPKKSLWDKIFANFTTASGTPISRIRSETGKALAEMFLNWQKYKPEEKKKVFEAWKTKSEQITEDIIGLLVNETLGTKFDKRDDVIALDKKNTEEALEATKRILSKFIQALKDKINPKEAQISESLIVSALLTAGLFKQLLGQNRQSGFDFQVKNLFLNTLAKYLEKSYRIENASKIVFDTWKGDTLSKEEKEALIQNYRKPLFRNPQLTGEIIQQTVNDIFGNKETENKESVEEKIANKLKPLIHEMLTKGK